MKTALSINQPFKDWVNHLKQDIRSAQIKAAVRVNSELLHLYWQLGGRNYRTAERNDLGKRISRRVES